MKKDKSQRSIYLVEDTKTQQSNFVNAKSPNEAKGKFSEKYKILKGQLRISYATKM